MQRQPATRGLRKWQDRTQPQQQQQRCSCSCSASKDARRKVGRLVGRLPGRLEGWSMWDAFMLMLRLRLGHRLLLPCPQVVALI